MEMGIATEAQHEPFAPRRQVHDHAGHVLLQREGWPVNAKRIWRLYGEKGLTPSVAVEASSAHRGVTDVGATSG